jgi:hypothetical protein
MAVSVALTPGRTIRWRKRRFVVVDSTGFDAIIAREVGKRRLARIPVSGPRRGSWFDSNLSGAGVPTSLSDLSAFAHAGIRFSSSAFSPGAPLLSRSTITRSKGNGAERSALSFE